MNTSYYSLSRWMVAALLIMTANIVFASSVNFTFQSIDPQTVQINFSNNSYVTQDRAEEIVYGKIASLVLRQGNKYFELIEPVYSQQFVSNRSENTNFQNTKTTYGNPGNIYARPIAKEVQITFPRYTFTAKVKMYRKASDNNTSARLYNANNVIKRISKLEKAFKKVKLHDQNKRMVFTGAPAKKMTEDSLGNVNIQNNLSEKVVEYTNESHEFLKDEKWVEAIRTASAAINLDPNFDVPYLNRATAYVQHGYLSKAIQDVDHALALNPNNPLSVNLKGYTLAQSGRNSDAVRYYEKACLMELNMACENFKEVAGYRPDDLEDRTKFYLGLAQDAFNKKQWNKAVAESTHVLTLNPQSVEAYTLRGAAYSELNYMDNALQDLNNAVTINPDFAAAYHSRARIYELMGSKDDAKLQFEIACNLGLKPSCKEYNRLNAVVKK